MIPFSKKKPHFPPLQPVNFSRLDELLSFSKFAIQEGITYFAWGDFNASISPKVEPEALKDLKKRLVDMERKIEKLEPRLDHLSLAIGIKSVRSSS